MTTTADYTNRKRDILPLLEVGDPDRSTFMSFSLVNPYISAGVQKGVVIWTTAFLTRKGTVKSDDTYGTDFLLKARRGVLNTDNQINTAFVTAARDISNWLAANGTDLDDDERVATAELTSFERISDNLFLNVHLTFVSGVTYEYLAPIRL